MRDVRASATQSDGKIVAMGICIDPAGIRSDICVTRLQRDGAGIDLSFANNGFVRASSVRARSNASYWPFALSVDANDQITIGGQCGIPESTFGEGCVIRFTANGAFDASFGRGGIVVPETSETVSAIRILSDGKIVLAGMRFTGFYRDYFVTKLLANGTTDPTFNGGPPLNLFGRAVGELALGENRGPFVDVDSGGKIVITGRCRFGSPPIGDMFCAARVTSNGVLDTTFNGTGVKAWSPRGELNDSGSGVAIGSTGRIFVAGTCQTAGTGKAYFCVSALDNQGAIDPTFASNGTFVSRSVFSPSPSLTLHLLDNGRLLLVGRGARYTDNAGFAPNQFIQFKYDGFGDLGFADDGEYSDTSDGRDLMSSSFVTPDKKVLVSGGRSNTGWIARYDFTPPPAERCSLDLDDDGRILPQTDGVMWLRIMLGFRGNAVTQGAVASAAQFPNRSTWPQIQSYLFNRCGIR